MNSKPFEIRYLIAHAFNAPVRSSFTRKGPEKLCGSEKFLGSFEKRRNYFLFFTFHANSWRRVTVYTSNTMATLSHGCKPISLTDKTVFPLIYAPALLLSTTIIQFWSARYSSMFRICNLWISHSKETSNHIISPETCMLEEVREICWNLVKSLKNRSETGKGRSVFVRKKNIEGSRIQYYIVLPFFVLFCFVLFFTILLCMIKFF